VFFKGCPLSCHWCDNPESQNSQPELGLIKDLCNKCGKCVKVCPVEAIAMPNSFPQIDREKCTLCGKCVEVCTLEALKIYGRTYSVEEVFQEVIRDKLFYSSDGGITLSGGEPLLQSQFAISLLNICRQNGISTAIETSGYAEPKLLKAVLGFTDYVMYDLKHMDPKRHRMLTGKTNRLILNNAQLATKSGVKIQFRMPVIPGINDSLDNIKMVSSMIKDLQGEEGTIELMPYHMFGLSKYEALDRAYFLKRVSRAEPDYIATIVNKFEKMGVQCLVSS
jgi:pyruvate formate lyase activating enzyme